MRSHAISWDTNRDCVYLLAYFNPDGDTVLNLSQGHRNIEHADNTKCNERYLPIQNLLGRNETRKESPGLINNADQLVEQIGVALLSSQYIKQALANQT